MIDVPVMFDIRDLFGHTLKNFHHLRMVFAVLLGVLFFGFFAPKLLKLLKRHTKYK